VSVEAIGVESAKQSFRLRGKVSFLLKAQIFSPSPQFHLWADYKNARSPDKTRKLLKLLAAVESGEAERATGRRWRESAGCAGNGLR
jgi:hypothetical protein